MTRSDRLWRLPAVLLLAAVCASPWRLALPTSSAAAPAAAVTPRAQTAQVTLPNVTPRPARADATGQASSRGARSVGEQSSGLPNLQRPITPAPQRPPQSPPPAPPPARPTPELPLRPGDFPRGRYHLVQEGETAAAVATAYGVRGQWVIYDANPSVVHPDELPVGSWLYIPHPSLLPAERPRPGQPGWSSTPSSNVIVDQVWLDLAACESSGDWGIDSGNGYYGGLQFLPSSWRAVGGQGWPHHAHPLEQIARADALQRLQGWKAWPVCSVKLGLRSPDEPASGASPPSASPGPAEPQQ